MTTEKTADADTANHSFTPVASARPPLPSQEEMLPIQPPQSPTPAKRQKTRGEKIFDLATYGGFGLFGNEAASLIITHQAKEGALKKPYDAFVKYFTDMEGKAHVPKYLTEGRLPMVITACIGGMFMVLPIKYLEDRKGAIVRNMDRSFYGDKVDSDSHLREAHEEMDQAPKQTWGSLGKGRVITVISALGADALFGWKKSLSARLLKDTPVEKFSSLDHIAEQTAHGLTDPMMKLFKTTDRPKMFSIVENSTWLLTLSTTLTILFYATSKLFAKNSAVRKERNALANAGSTASDSYRDSTPEQPELAAPSDKPKTSVSEIADYQPMIPTREVSMQLG